MITSQTITPTGASLPVQGVPFSSVLSLCTAHTLSGDMQFIMINDSVGTMAGCKWLLRAGALGGWS